eukprot:5109347-Pleurochrysis_carterae.AAC.4
MCFSSQHLQTNAHPLNFASNSRCGCNNYCGYGRACACAYLIQLRTCTNTSKHANCTGSKFAQAGGNAIRSGEAGSPEYNQPTVSSRKCTYARG